MNLEYIKICGITREEDLVAVENSGATHIGFIAFPKSKRYISAEQLKTLLTRGVPMKTMPVGVFVNATCEEIKPYVEAGIKVIQLHGDETGEFIQKLRHEFPEQQLWKALHITDKSDLAQYNSLEIDAFLLDSCTSTERGGTGIVMDWDVAKKAVQYFDKPVILAGGLNEKNIAEAIRVVAPQGVDMSSGVEISPGIKSTDKIMAVFTALGK